MILTRKPKLFIGSSLEGISLAKNLNTHIEDVAEVTIWNQGVFKLAENTLESLIKASNEYDFAVFIFSKDDMLKFRNKEFQTVRDNVIFELGLFIGSIGKERTYFVMPKYSEEFRFPSDLLGITAATYEDRSDGNILASLTTAAEQIRERINRFKFRSHGYYNGLELYFKKNGDTDRKFNLSVISKIKEKKYNVSENLCRAYLKQFPYSYRARYNLIVSILKQVKKINKQSNELQEAINIFENLINEDFLLFLKIRVNIYDPIQFIIDDTDFKKLFIYNKGLLAHVISYKKIFYPDMGTEEYGMGGCFTKDMKVLLWNKTYKPIGDIKKGDKVFSYNEKQVPMQSIVEKVFVTTSIPVIINNRIKVTNSQRLLADNRTWTYVKDLRIGDYLMSNNYVKIRIETIETCNFLEDVYSVELSPYHNYVIEDVIAHNKIFC